MQFKNKNQKGTPMNTMMICFGLAVGIGLINCSITHMQSNECCLGISQLFLAASCLLLCWAFTSNNDALITPWLQLPLFVVLFNAGLVCYFLAVFLVFIDFMRDPFFQYSPYVAMIGLSLITVFGNLANNLV